MTPLLADADPALAAFGQYCLIGLVIGSLYALIALGYTMVYGIVELINFAHGDLFMLGSFLALTLVMEFGLTGVNDPAGKVVPAMLLMLVACPLFCATINVSVDRLIYKPLRTAPKLAPLVSALGVSFIFMNIGLFWFGSYERDVPNILPKGNLVAGTPFQFTWNDLLVVAVTVPTMVALTLFVKYTALGKAMRATAQNPTAAQLMGINVDRVIAATFAIGGALAGVASVIYGFRNGTVGFQMGFQNGLYAFTAAVLGGIGNIPGAVIGGLVIGLVKSLGSAYVDAKWNEALIFGILILILIFRPNGLLGARTREKV
jgi:branched-chain amino acid transport system permease protein